MGCAGGFFYKLVILPSICIRECERVSDFLIGRCGLRFEAIGQHP